MKPHPSCSACFNRCSLSVAREMLVLAAGNTLHVSSTIEDHRARRPSCLVLLLDIAAGHDPHEAHTHLLQAAAGDSTISVQAPTRISAQPASSLVHTCKANDPHNTLHLSPTDVTLRNAIFHTKQYLIACAHIPSADPRAPHSNYQTVFPSPQKRCGHETSGVARGGLRGLEHPPFALVEVYREWQGSAGFDCVALLPGQQDRSVRLSCGASRVRVRQTAPPPTPVRARARAASAAAKKF